MKYVLMNKNKMVMLIDYNDKDFVIEKIYEVYNMDCAPLNVINAINDKSKSLLSEVNSWYKSRGIPSWRKNLANLLEKLNVSSPEELLNKSFSLSLSD